MVLTKPQSWEAVLAEHDPPVAEAARAVQRLVEANLPGAVVQFDPGNKAPGDRNLHEDA